MADSNEYVTPTPGGGWRVAGTRVSLASVAYAHRAGKSPEAIAADFPTLSLEQVNAAIAYYLRHRADVDRHLAALDTEWERHRAESAASSDPLLQRLRAAAQVRP